MSRTKARAEKYTLAFRRWTWAVSGATVAFEFRRLTRGTLSV
jgi:hypothetical protein